MKQLRGHVLWAYAVGILFTSTLLLWCLAFLLRNRSLLVGGMVAMCTTVVFIEAGFVIQAIRRSQLLFAALTIAATLVIVIWVALPGLDRQVWQVIPLSLPLGLLLLWWYWIDRSQNTGSNV